jgi:uncharacterized membrane protein HdeD (DUF308 family)
MSSIEKMNRKDTNLWVSILKGAMLIVFGVWLLKSPTDNLMKLSMVFGIIIILGGLLEVGLAFSNRKNSIYSGWAIGSGVLDILIGAFLVSNPSFILLLITGLVSIWLLIRGIISIRYALNQKNENNPNYVYGLLFGIVLILLAIIFVWHPNVLGITIAFWTALAFISFGIFRIVFVFKIQKL